MRPLSPGPRVKLKHFGPQETDIICVVCDKRKDFTAARSDEQGLNDRPRLAHQVSNHLITGLEKKHNKKEAVSYGEGK